jgi:hypothetical protein
VGLGVGSGVGVGAGVDVGVTAGAGDGLASATGCDGDAVAPVRLAAVTPIARATTRAAASNPAVTVRLIG